MKDLWWEYTTYVYIDGEHVIPACGLCGNTGIINTLQSVKSLQQHCGLIAYCICPNGRAKKRAETDQPKWGGTSVLTKEGAICPKEKKD